jgi:hypothetical protein
MRRALNAKLIPRRVAELPKDLREHVLHEDFVRFTKGKLRLMLVVVDKYRWIPKVGQALVGDEGSPGRCHGIVYPLTWTVENPTTGKTRQEFAPEIMSLLVLSKDKLTGSILTHECVHAAFNYAYRVSSQSSPWKLAVTEDADKSEEICYPAGEIMKAVLVSLHRKGLVE